MTKDEDILATVIPSASSVDDAAGTCMTGKSNDFNAVVGSHAKVFGVKGLRVVDASTFPFWPPGHL